MEWYKNLSINQRINAKECFELLCGISWTAAGKLFSIRERAEMMHQKLRIEGFAV